MTLLTGTLTGQSRAKFPQHAVAAQSRREAVRNEHDEEHRVGWPHVGGVAAHPEEGGGLAARGEKLLQRAHRSASSSAILRTQSLPPSMSSRSVRARRNRLPA